MSTVNSVFNKVITTQETITQTQKTIIDFITKTRPKNTRFNRIPRNRVRNNNNNANNTI